jgi:hypothetical protein
MLLVQLGDGATTHGEEELLNAVQQEFLRGVPLYSEILESGSMDERFHCIDLLSICAGIDPNLIGRVRGLMRQVARLGEREAELAATVLADLER